jgi:hypothetical protein
MSKFHRVTKEEVLEKFWAKKPKDITPLKKKMYLQLPIVGEIEDIEVASMEVLRWILSHQNPLFLKVANEQLAKYGYKVEGMGKSVSVLPL